MARSIIHLLFLLLGLSVFSAETQAQQVTFAMSPTQVTPNIGDTVRLNVVVTNFDSIVSFQYAVEWDPALFSFVNIDNKNLPDVANLGENPVGGNTVLVGWNSNGALPRSVVNGQAIYRINLRVLANSTNYWARFSGTNTSVEVIKHPSQSVTPAFGSLGTPPGSNSTALSLTTSSHTVATNTKVCVGVTANNFSNIVSAQWTTKWNPAVLRFDSLSTFNTTLGFNASNFGTTQASSGRVFFSWNPSGNNTTVPNGDTLYKVCFTAIGASGTNSQVTLDSSEVFRRTNGNDARITVSQTAGTVTVSGGSQPVTGLQFVSSNHTVTATGENVVVSVRTANFSNIASMSWSMHWDSTRATFVKARLASSTLGTDSVTVAGGSSNNFNQSSTGTLRFLWITPTADGSGVNLPDSTSVIEVTLRYTGAAGTSSPFRFDGIPQRVQVLNGNLQSVPVTFKPSALQYIFTAPAITLISNTQNVSCPNGTNGSISMTVGGGNGSFSYAWTGPNGFTASTKDIINLRAGTYRVTITSGPSTRTDSFNITQPTAWAVVPTVTNVACFGQPTGAISVTVSGATAPYSYRWISGENTQNITGKAAGNYTLTITDSRACAFTTNTLTITQPASAVAIATNPVIRQVSCANGTDGSIDISVSGGTAPYSFAWAGPNGFTRNTEDLTALGAGRYTVTITDANGCTATRSDSITQPLAIAIGNATVTDARCGLANGAITVASITGGTAPYMFAWTGPNGFTASTQNINNITTGSYQLRVTDSRNCTANSSTLVVNNANSNFIFSVTSQTNVRCNGATTGAIGISVSGGTAPYRYRWSSRVTDTLASVANLGAGSYTVTVTDATGCSQVSSAYVITQPSALVLTTPSVTNVACKGGATGAILVNATGGTSPYTYAWTGPNGFSSSSLTSINNVRAGNYSLTVTDANGCTQQRTATVSEPTDSIRITNTNRTNIACNGDLTGAVTITVAGGTAPYRYAWAGPNGFTAATQNISNVAGGTYTVVITDANNCQFTSPNIVVLQPAVLDATAVIVNAANTNNGSITVSVTGGTAPYTFSWSGVAAAAQNQQNQTGLCNGNYTVTITDINGCRTTKTFSVGGACSEQITISPVVTPSGCPGQNLGKIDITVRGGTAPLNYEWYINNVLIARTKDVANLVPGDYRVKITDAVGQTYLSEIITVRGSQTAVRITTVTKTPETCTGNDGSITVSATDGALPYTYRWNNTASNVPTNTGLRAGTYAVTITDNNGCIKDTSGIVVPRENCPLVVIKRNAKQVKCNGGNEGAITIDIQNGEPGYVIKWSPTDSVAVNNFPRRDASFEITGLRAGNYVVTVTDARGQRREEPVTVSEPNVLSIAKNITPDNGSCSGAIVLAVTGGTPQYTYRWNTGQTSRDLFGLCCRAGVYSVTVTDANGCTAMTSNDSIQCNITTLVVDANITNAVCPADTPTMRIVLTVTGGTPNYGFQWSNGTRTVGNGTAILTGVPTGRYFVTVTDNSRPTPQVVIRQYDLRISSSLAAGDLTVTTASNASAADGTATIVATGGVAPYTFRWCDGTTNTTGTNNALRAGSCAVTITDAQGCSVVKSFTISTRDGSCFGVRLNSQFVSGSDTFNVKCAGDCNASATVVNLANTLALPVSYAWASGEVGPTAFRLCGGNNRVTVTDAVGRVCSLQFNVKEPTPLEADIRLNNDQCSAEGLAFGGVAPYSYRWTSIKGDTSRVVTDLVSGRIFLLVTDGFGCSAVKESTLSCGDDELCLSGSVILTPYEDDGRNDGFLMESCDYSKIRFEVYNRWGQLVYQNDNYTNGTWKGRDRDGDTGNLLPEGVYLYILKGTDSNGNVATRKGTVSLLRP